MHERCINPVWPCAMVGAASCLAGFSNLGVIIHGSAGCYNYAEMAVPDPLHCTYLIEEEIVFGTGDRLHEIAGAVNSIYEHIAIINTCVPSIIGDDSTECLEGYNAIVADIPGFTGDFDIGYRKALNTIKIECDLERDGVNIDGICSIDPFARGNLLETKRLFSLAKVKPAAIFCHDTLESATSPARLGVSVNTDYNRANIDQPGSILGIDELIKTFSEIHDHLPETEYDAVISEADEAEERIVKACDKYLRKNDPPRVAIFSTKAYTEFSINSLKKYLDAEICFAGLRNSDDTSISGIQCSRATDIRKIKENISLEKPDLILGSSFEKAGSPKTPFLGITFPQRSRVMLHNKPIAGIEGSLAFMEDVLNYQPISSYHARN